MPALWLGLMFCLESVLINVNIVAGYERALV